MPQTIKVTGLKDVQNFLKNLTDNQKQKIGKEGTYAVANSLKRRIKYRYTLQGYGTSDWSSGRGYNSIKSKRTNKGAIVNIGDNQTSGYLYILENGFRIHQVSKKTLREHRNSPGSTVGRSQPQGTSYEGEPITVHWRGPFIEPAFKTLKKDIPKILKPYINKTIN